MWKESRSSVLLSVEMFDLVYGENLLNFLAQEIKVELRRSDFVIINITSQ